MRVILDTSSVSSERQSSHRYFSEIIPRMHQRSDISLEVIPSPYFDIPQSWKAASQVHETIFPKANWLPQGKLRQFLSKIKWFIENKRRERNLGQKNERAVFHTFFYTLPPNKDLVFVPIALDLIVEKFGTELGLSDAAIAAKDQKRKCFQSATRIMAISEATKKDLCEYYGISKEKVDVVYMAVNQEFFGTAPEQNEKEAFLKKHLINRPFLLQVGGRMHHRNFSRLAEAFALTALNQKYLLVCAGEEWSQEERDLLAHLKIEDRVRLVRSPTNEELRILYHSAKMLVYPSLYEGFGIPIVEAMAAGLPVITSQGAGSIPEVAGSAALYFDAKNPKAIAQTIERLEDPKLQEECRKRGLENAQKFTWDATTNGLIRVYEKALGSA